MRKTQVLVLIAVLCTLCKSEDIPQSSPRDVHLRPASRYLSGSTGAADVSSTTANGDGSSTSVTDGNTAAMLGSTTASTVATTTTTTSGLSMAGGEGSVNGSDGSEGQSTSESSITSGESQNSDADTEGWKLIVRTKVDRVSAMTEPYRFEHRPVTKFVPSARPVFNPYQRRSKREEMMELLHILKGWQQDNVSGGIVVSGIIGDLEAGDEKSLEKLQELFANMKPGRDHSFANTVKDFMQNFAHLNVAPPHRNLRAESNDADTKWKVFESRNGSHEAGGSLWSYSKEAGLPSEQGGSSGGDRQSFPLTRSFLHDEDFRDHVRHMLHSINELESTIIETMKITESNEVDKKRLAAAQVMLQRLWGNATSAESDLTLYFQNELEKMLEEVRETETYQIPHGESMEGRYQKTTASLSKSPSLPASVLSLKAIAGLDPSEANIGTAEAVEFVPLAKGQLVRAKIAIAGEKGKETVISRRMLEGVDDQDSDANHLSTSFSSDSEEQESDEDSHGEKDQEYLTSFVLMLYQKTGVQPTDLVVTSWNRLGTGGSEMVVVVLKRSGDTIEKAKKIEEAIESIESFSRWEYFQTLCPCTVSPPTPGVFPMPGVESRGAFKAKSVETLNGKNGRGGKPWTAPNYTWLYQQDPWMFGNDGRGPGHDRRPDKERIAEVLERRLNGCAVRDFQLSGMVMKAVKRSTVRQCGSYCLAQFPFGCRFFSYNHFSKQCWLHASQVGFIHSMPGTTSGRVPCTGFDLQIMEEWEPSEYDEVPVPPELEVVTAANPNGSLIDIWTHNPDPESMGYSPHQFLYNVEFQSGLGWDNWGRWMGDYDAVSDWRQCHAMCRKDSRCRYWTYTFAYMDEKALGGCFFKTGKKSLAAIGPAFQSIGGPKDLVLANSSAPVANSRECFAYGFSSIVPQFIPQDVYDELTDIRTPEDCQALCFKLEAANCAAFTFKSLPDSEDAECTLLRTYFGQVATSPWAVTGPRDCNVPLTLPKIKKPRVPLRVVNGTCFERGKRLNGTLVEKESTFRRVPSGRACQERCAVDKECAAFSFGPSWGGCYLFKTIFNAISDEAMVSGPRKCGDNSNRELDSLFDHNDQDPRRQLLFGMTPTDSEKVSEVQLGTMLVCSSVVPNVVVPTSLSSDPLSDSYGVAAVATPLDCKNLCQASFGCMAWTHSLNHNICHLRNESDSATVAATFGDATSGTADCTSPLGTFTADFDLTLTQPLPAGSCYGLVEYGKVYMPGQSISGETKTPSWTECQALCAKSAGCSHFTYILQAANFEEEGGACELKSGIEPAEALSGDDAIAISGPANCTNSEVGIEGINGFWIRLLQAEYLPNEAVYWNSLKRKLMVSLADAYGVSPAKVRLLRFGSGSVLAEFQYVYTCVYIFMICIYIRIPRFCRFTASRCACGGAG
eukprot:GHVU01145554.1.p1 GENE.GHVU01145554.1~~GHVU01145554.1.p1  ORF type:complete len:1410 (+),score=144.45 GHVU01145554.1:168-4397(+)